MKLINTLCFIFITLTCFTQIDSLDYVEIYSKKNQSISDSKLKDLRYVSIDVMFINPDIAQDQISLDIFGRRKRIKLMQTDLIVDGLGNSAQPILFPIHFANLVSKKNPKYYKREYTTVFENVPRSAFQSSTINAEIKRKMSTSGTLADVKNYVSTAKDFINNAAGEVATLATTGAAGADVIKIGSQIAENLAGIIEDSETSEKTYSIRLHEFNQRDEELVEVKIYRLQKNSETSPNFVNSFPTKSEVMYNIIPQLEKDSKHGYVVVLTRYSPFSFSHKVESQITPTDRYLEIRKADLMTKELSARQTTVENHFQLVLNQAIRLKKELELYDDKVSHNSIDTVRLTELFADYYTLSSNYLKYKSEDNYYLDQYDALYNSMNVELEKFRRHEFNDRKKYIEFISKIVIEQNYIDKIDDMRKHDLEKNLKNLHFVKDLLIRLESRPEEQLSDYSVIIDEMEGKLFSTKYSADVNSLKTAKTSNDDLRSNLYNSLIECKPYCHSCVAKINDALTVYDSNMKVDRKAKAESLYNQLSDGILADIGNFDRLREEIRIHIENPENQFGTSMLETLKSSFKILDERITAFSNQYSSKQFERFQNPTIEQLDSFNSAYTTSKSEIEHFITQYKNIGFVANNSTESATGEHG